MLDLSTAFVPVVSLASRYAVSFLVKSPWFNLVNKEDKGRKHLAALGVSLVLSLVVAVLSGTLTEASLNDAVLVLFNVLFGYTGSVAVHEVDKNSRLP